MQDNDDFWDTLDVLEDCLYDSADGNMHPEATEADLFHFEDPILTEVVATALPLSTKKKIVITSDDEIKRINVDTLKAELHKCDLSKSGKKVKLLEKLKYTSMVNKTPLTAETTCSLAPNGFDERARWRLISGSK